MVLKKYHHLHKEQRYRIECLLASGHSQRDVAKEIGVHASTISREKARNSGKSKRYDHLEANQKSIERRSQYFTSQIERDFRKARKRRT